MRWILFLILLALSVTCLVSVIDMLDAGHPDATIIPGLGVLFFLFWASRIAMSAPPKFASHPKRAPQAQQVSTEDSVRMMREIIDGLDKMENRVGNLETIIMDRSH